MNERMKLKDEVIQDMLINVTWGDIKPFIENGLKTLYSAEDVTGMMRFADINPSETPLGIFILAVMRVGRVNFLIAKMGYEGKDKAESIIKDKRDEIASLTERFFRNQKLKELDAIRDA